MPSFDKPPSGPGPGPASAPQPLQSIDRLVDLVRTRDDRTLYEMAGVGWMQTGGFFGGSEVNVHADGVTWRCGKQGFFGTVFAAKNAAGGIDGRFSAAFLGSGGTMEWAGHPEYKVRKAGFFNPRYLLMHGSMILCEFTPLGGKSLVRVQLRRDGLPGGLILFGAYVAQQLRKQQSRSSGGGGVGGSTAGCGGGGGCGGGS